MADQYLVKKHNTWHCVVNVPPRLRKAAGQARLRRSLKTSNLNEANRLKLPVVEEFKKALADLEKGQINPDAALFKDASEWRGALALATNITREYDGREVNERDELLSIIKDQAKELAELRGDETASRFFKAATGSGTLIKDSYPTWTSEVVVSGQTRSQHTSTLKRYLAWAGDYAIVEETDRRKAGEYVTELLSKSGLSRATIKRHLSSLSQFWEWLNSKGFANDNPWLRHKLGKKAKKPKRTSLTDEMILSLLKGRSRSEKFATLLSDLVRLALLTGARLDELCALKKRDIHKREDGYWLSITDGKTEAAARDIPLHSDGVSIIKRRLKDEGDYLFAGLIPGGPDDKRSWYVSKAYGRFRQQVNVNERWQDFHALRHTFTSLLEGLEIPESTTKLLIGHARTSMTYGLYSKGKRVELRKVIEQIDYGAPIMKAISQPPTE